MMTLCALAIALSLAVPSQTAKASANPDLKELSTYALSLDTLNKVDRVMRTFAVDMKKDLKIQADL